LVDQATILPNEFVPVDQVTTFSIRIRTIALRFPPSPQSGFPSSLVLNLRVSFITVDRLTMPRMGYLIFPFHWLRLTNPTRPVFFALFQENLAEDCYSSEDF
jgi:hypothetical protein